MKASEIVEQAQTIPADTYKLGVKGCEPAYSKEKALPMLKMDYVVTEGEYKGRHVFENIMLIPASLWVLKKFLIAIGEGELELPITTGADGAYVIDEKGCFEVICSTVIGQEVLVDVSVEPENKEKGWKAKNRVIEYYPGTSRTAFTTKGAGVGEAHWAD